MNETDQSVPVVSAPGVEGLLHALLLDGQGGAQALDAAGLALWQPDHGVLWLHLDYTSEFGVHYLKSLNDEHEAVVQQLLNEESRPRATVVQDGVLIALRGVNLHPDANVEDMVSVRLWATSDRVISTRRRRLLSVLDVADALRRSQGPCDSAEIIVQLGDQLTLRMQDTIDALDERVARIETDLLSSPDASLRSEISSIRRVSIMLRRYLAPQREALNHLASARLPWLKDEHKLLLREVIDRLVRHIEDLDSTRERAAVAQEELVNHQSEQLNTRMYVLSLVSVVFLPLGFLTGLLGVNVGGIPGADNPWGFAVFVVIVLAIALALLVYFRKRGWL